MKQFITFITIVAFLVGCGNETTISDGLNIGEGELSRITPTELQISALSSSEIKLNWKQVSGIDVTIFIERGTSASGPFVEIGNVSNDETSDYSDTQVVPSTTYFYRIYGKNEQSESLKTDLPVSATTLQRQSVPPQTPTGILANTISDTIIQISWNEVENETGYRVERRIKDDPDPDFLMVVSTGADPTLPIMDTQLTPSTTYEYRVIAFNLVGESPPSTPLAEATTQTPPLQGPASPSNISATPEGGSNIKVIWMDNSNNEDFFRIRRREVVGGVSGSWSSVGLGTPTGSGIVSKDTEMYVDKNVPDGIYQYRIRSENSAGKSSYTGPSNGASI